MYLIFSVAGFLVLPLAMLLLAQWPLRDWLHAYAREANDFAQVFFALYVAVAISAATRANAHLKAAPTLLSSPHTVLDTRWRHFIVLLCLGPWAAFVLWTASPFVWQSIRQFERFSETGNGGFFIIKFASCLLVFLVLFEALLQTFSRARRSI